MSHKMLRPFIVKVCPVLGYFRLQGYPSVTTPTTLLTGISSSISSMATTGEL